MNKKLNILVTGCGGDIGQSICKILKRNILVQKTVGCDIHQNHPGKFLVDEFHLIPGCTLDNYLPELQKLVEDRSIDIIIPTSEPELRFFLKKQIIKNIFNRPMIMANKKALEIGFDKLKTAQFLKDSGLPFPETVIIGDIKNVGFPVVLKSRDGSGSKQVVILNDKFDFQYYKRKHPEFIIQEYLGNEKVEYTCGLFRSKIGNCRNVIFNRTLSGGYSNFGIVVQGKIISQLLNKIGDNLELEGSINVQLRLTQKGPVVFEINPRFSSTVLFRDLLGFKDLIWAIEDNLGMPISSYVPIEEGRKFYKGYQEYYE
ncbi:ATP-grasp domain-containing protein [bacterium]|nr:MAG: ATP-grasp domain-containing protein [bacterium]